MQALTFIFAFIAVLALIGVAAWLVRRFATNRLGANTQRGRMPRLAVIDAAAVDGRRRLVLVRRDNVEHLLMIGGPTDIVVEPNIVRAAPGRDQLPQRPGTAEPPRLAPMPETGGWVDEAPRPESLDHPEPQMPEPPPRPARPSFADEVRRQAPLHAERRSEPLSGFATEPMMPRVEREPRPEPMPPRMPRSEPAMPRPPRHAEPAKVPPVRAERAAAPPPIPPAPPPAAAPSSAEQNLAEMAQRLEAALRRPAGETVAPPVAPEPPAPAARPSRGEAPAPAAAPKSSFENLEDEMASLLGRPKPSS
ncbi:flagellar biosynthetic protein FliO [Bradyrhizobium sp.]|uniref:flagellar biosynthetic protein FliO n=1 Tax=Bradyrhizobium sp. TaxID=376 RepID=UPI00238C851C|nr:flagellar biosynthetic protein FliO [Bradyrhizobium sp.]MDE2376726.1 flagellar biosynthetic protein FliO [Bradyrhizobium sp.]